MERAILDFAGDCKNLKYSRIITGQKSHPSIIKDKIKPPDYIRQFLQGGSHSNSNPDIGLLIEGKCVNVIEGKTFLMKPGDICIINGGMKNYESFYKKEIGYEIIWIIFSFAYKLKAFNAVYEPKTGYKIKSSITLKVNTKMMAMIEEIFVLPENGKHFDKTKEILCGWFDIIREMLEKKKYTKRGFTDELRKSYSVKAKRIEKGVKYIKLHYRENLKLKDIAAQASVSPSHFRFLFKEVYNDSLFEFIIKLRLDAACVMLKKPGLSIKQIANKNGYEDPYFFSRIFKKYVGVSPEKYRNKYLPAPLVFNP